ncbi:ribonuclease H-like domain-containing protein [Tanacetum coccineum]
MVTQNQDGTRKITQCLNLHVSHISPIPKSPSLSLLDPQWQDAMYDEYNALIKNYTWVLVPKSYGANIVRSRLVANESSQQLAIDCDETFSLVVKPAIFRIVLSIALTRHWHIHQLDVTNVFLNGDLLETIYMHQPPGFVDPWYPHHVCRLQRSLYGLKQGLVPSFNDLLLMLPELDFLQVDVILLYLFTDLLLERAHMLNCNPTRTPVNTESNLGHEENPISDPTLYRVFSQEDSSLCSGNLEFWFCRSIQSSDLLFVVVLGTLICSGALLQPHR